MIHSQLQEGFSNRKSYMGLDNHRPRREWQGLFYENSTITYGSKPVPYRRNVVFKILTQIHILQD